MLTDTQSIMLEPLIEACRPHAKVPPRHLRRTIGPILWRHDNGARWRAPAAIIVHNLTNLFGKVVVALP